MPQQVGLISNTSKNTTGAVPVRGFPCNHLHYKAAFSITRRVEDTSGHLYFLPFLLSVMHTEAETQQRGAWTNKEVYIGKRKISERICIYFQMKQK